MFDLRGSDRSLELTANSAQVFDRFPLICFAIHTVLDTKTLFIWISLLALSIFRLSTNYGTYTLNLIGKADVCATQKVKKS